MAKIGHKNFPLLYFEELYQGPLKTLAEDPLPPLAYLDLFQYTYMKYTEVQDPLQDLAIRYNRFIADKILDYEGRIINEELKAAVKVLEQRLYCLIPGFEDLHPFLEHSYKILKQLQNRSKLRDRFHKIYTPFREKKSRELLYRSLQLSMDKELTNRESRKAILLCLLNHIRQSVGSCFATAPAVLIQQEQPYQFLEDFDELITKGKLQRVVEGFTHEVPISPSAGVGDLKRPFIMGKQGIKPWYHPPLINLFKKLGFLDKESSFLDSAAWLRVKCRETGLHEQKTFTFETLIQKLLENLLGVESIDWDYKEPSLSPSTLLPPKFLKLALGNTISKHQPKKENALELFQVAKEIFLGTTEVPLLKTWEFSLASFAECRVEFSQRNMYHGLGIDSKEEGGLGFLIVRELEVILNEINEKVENLNHDCEAKYAEIIAVEGRLNRPSSEDELRWLRSKHQILDSEFSQLKEKREVLHHNGQRISGLYPYLVDKYMALLPHYFQEIYDAEMNEVKATLYDDRPAGFRLLYKHGRAQSYLWSKIFNEEAYIEALLSFFRQSEVELSADIKLEGLEKLISHLHQTIENHLKTPAFIAYSLQRMNKSQTQKSHATPWSYVSGGSMHDLLCVYYKNEPKVLRKKVSSVEDLMLFIVETLQEIPRQQLDLEEGGISSMLMHSPTHAFVLKPGWLQDLVGENVKPYKYIESFKQKTYGIIQKIGSNSDHIAFMHEYMHKNLNLKGQISLRPHEMRDWKVWRREFLSRIKGDIGEFEKIFLQSLPLTETYQVEGILLEFLNSIQKDEEKNREKVGALISKGFESRYVTMKELKHLMQLLLIDIFMSAYIPQNAFQQIQRFLQDKSCLFCSPVLFADTNWCHNYFAFLYHPYNDKLELWRVGCHKELKGPMYFWDEHFKGNQESEWGIYTHPKEYYL